MLKKTVTLGILIVLGVFGSSCKKTTVKTTCDRACLVDMMDQYLAAVVQHNPAGVPIASDVKFVENLNAIPVGKGLWKPPAPDRLNSRFMLPTLSRKKSDSWVSCRTRANRCFWAPA